MNVAAGLIRGRSVHLAVHAAQRDDLLRDGFGGFVARAAGRGRGASAVAGGGRVLSSGAGDECDGDVAFVV